MTRVWRNVSCLCCFVNGRNRCHLHSQGGLDHPDSKTHHEVAEGKVAGPRQQGRETHAVQRNLRQEHQGVHTEACMFVWNFRLLWKDNRVTLFSKRSTPTRWRSLKWSPEMPVATGARWRPKTSATAPLLRSRLRVSGNGPPWRGPPGFRACWRLFLIWSRPNVRLLPLQLRSRSSRPTFCLPSRERKCIGGGGWGLGGGCMSAVCTCLLAKALESSEPYVVPGH